MKKRVLCFGDSNTWGYNPKDGTRFPEDVRWTGVLQAELGDGYTVIEEGYNGRTTVFDDPVENRPSGISYFWPCLDSQSPLDLIIIMLGTNDLKTQFGYGPEAIAYGMYRYLDLIKIAPLAGSHPKVLVMAPILVDAAYKNEPSLYRTLGEDADVRSKGFASAFRNFTKEYDLFFLDAGEYGTPSKIDGVHMESDSHKRLGIAVAKKAMEILG